MKQFFENYGAVALGILALLVLIAMITPVGNIIKTSLQGTTETFSTKIEAQTDTMTVQMQEAFESVSTETHYNENGILLNGIIDRTLYVDGVAYQNLWNQQENIGILFSSSDNYEVTETGYHLTATTPDPFVGRTTGLTLKYSNDQGQKYYYHEGKEYIFIGRNSCKNYIMYFDANGNNLSPVSESNGAYNGSYRTSIKRITNEEIPMKTSFFALRFGNGDTATIGQSYDFEIMVFEVPSDLEIDLSSL